jgi:1-acyl-sn-glycerol-3-phosphate acyltransferase
MTSLDAPPLGPFSMLASIDRSAFGTIGIVLGAVVVALAGFVAALPWIVQPFLRMVLFLRYDLRRIGLENIPRDGPVLLASNHISWFDGFFLAASLPRRGTALVNIGVFSMPVVGFLARRCGLIPVPYSGPKAQRAAIETCRQALDEGRVLGIFPEGELTRTGLTGKFHRGLEAILAKREQVPVVPVYLDNVWGSIMSHSGGRFVWKRPEGWRRTIVVSFGPPVEPPVTAFSVRQAVLVEGVKARAAQPKVPGRPEPVDPALPHFDHPTLGPLTGSAADVHEPALDVHQIGQKPGTVGLALPGVAIRAVDDAGNPQPADSEGRLEALVPGQPDWVDIGHRGRIDRDGFVAFSEATAPEGPKPDSP